MGIQWSTSCTWSLFERRSPHALETCPLTRCSTSGVTYGASGLDNHASRGYILLWKELFRFVSWCLLGRSFCVSLLIDPGAAGGAVGALFPPAAQLPWVSESGKPTHLCPTPAPCSGTPRLALSTGRVARLLGGMQEGRAPSHGGGCGPSSVSAGNLTALLVLL